MKLSIIGTGKMGSAMLKAALQSPILKPENVFIYDKNTNASLALQQEIPGITVCKSAQEAAALADVLLLAIKPQDMNQVLSQLAIQSDLIDTRSSEELPLILSIVSGITIESLQAFVDPETPIIRIMPNTPALIGQGATVFAAGPFATQESVDLVNSLLSKTGLLLQVPESQIDAITAISGSGPAYMFSILDAMASAGTELGLPRQTALQLSIQTMIGSAMLAQQSSKHVLELRDDVSSPGGTTIHALNAMDAYGLRAALIEGIRQAYERARTMGK